MWYFNWKWFFAKKTATYPRHQAIVPWNRVTQCEKTSRCTGWYFRKTAIVFPAFRDGTTFGIPKRGVEPLGAVTTQFSQTQRTQLLPTVASFLNQSRDGWRHNQPTSRAAFPRSTWSVTERSAEGWLFRLWIFGKEGCREEEKPSYLRPIGKACTCCNPLTKLAE